MKDSQVREFAAKRAREMVKSGMNDWLIKYDTPALIPEWQIERYRKFLKEEFEKYLHEEGERKKKQVVESEKRKAKGRFRR